MTGTIAELWRYPVKSMAGEALDRAQVDARGLAGDRHWSLWDERAGAIANGKKIPRLLQCTARYLEEPVGGLDSDLSAPVAIRLPNGIELHSEQGDADEQLSDFLGRKVALRPRTPVREQSEDHANRASLDAVRRELMLEPGQPWPDAPALPEILLNTLARLATPAGTNFDAYPLHLLSTGSLRALQARSPELELSTQRFRPNILVDVAGRTSPVEMGWCGTAVELGGAVVQIDAPTIRCSMTMRAQPGLPEDPRVLQATVTAGRCVGVYGWVEQSGYVALGDELRACAATA